MLRQNSLALGGSLENAIVVGRPACSTRCQFEDEFVRLDPRRIGDPHLLVIPSSGTWSPIAPATGFTRPSRARSSKSRHLAHRGRPVRPSRAGVPVTIRSRARLAWRINHSSCSIRATPLDYTRGGPRPGRSRVSRPRRRSRLPAVASPNSGSPDSTTNSGSEPRRCRKWWMTSSCRKQRRPMWSQLAGCLHCR